MSDKEHAQNSLDKFRRVLWFCMAVCLRLGSGYRVHWLSGIEGRIIQIISCTLHTSTEELQTDLDKRIEHYNNKCTS